MTFWHYDFDRGSSIHEHWHPEEEVWDVIEGELEVTIDGVTQIARAGLAGIVGEPARFHRTFGVASSLLLVAGQD